jgi:HEPN domain-containing protein
MERSADWMDQARGDLQHARSDVQGAFYDWACFSAQQAAEKAVKALFQRMGAVVWGHSVADLLEELTQRQAVPERCAVMPMYSSGACSTSGAWNLMCTQKRNMHR